MAIEAKSHFIIGDRRGMNRVEERLKVLSPKVTDQWALDDDVDRTVRHLFTKRAGISGGTPFIKRVGGIKIKMKLFPDNSLGIFSGEGVVYIPPDIFPHQINRGHKLLPFERGMMIAVNNRGNSLSIQLALRSLV